MKIYVLILLAILTALASVCASQETISSIQRSEDLHHHHHPGGIWRIRREWKAHWIKHWELKKVWVPAWKKVWAPVDIKEWIPVPDHHHDKLGHPEAILPR